MRSPPSSNQVEPEQPTSARQRCWDLWSACLDYLLAGMEDPKMRSKPAFIMCCIAFLKLNSVVVGVGQRTGLEAMKNLREAQDALTKPFGVIKGDRK